MSSENKSEKKVYSLKKNNVMTKINDSISIIHLKLTEEDINNVLLQVENINDYKPIQSQDNDDIFNKNNYFAYDHDLGEAKINNDIFNKLNLMLLNNLNTPNNYLMDTVSLKGMSEFSSLDFWPTRTNINCWWCCHSFTTTPVAIPNFIDKEIFYCTGCFCSFNCCLAYIYDENENINTRISLLKSMHGKLNGSDLDIQKVAISWKYLKSFGGVLSIEQFRQNAINVNNCNYNPYLLKYIDTDININLQKKLPFNNVEKPVATKSKPKTEFFTPVN